MACITMFKTTFRQKILLVILGASLSIIIIEIGMRTAGFLYLSLQEHRNKISLDKKGAYRIMCLGESTTAYGGENSYPRQLEEILSQKIPDMRFSVINKGIPAIDTTHIVEDLRYSL